MPRALLHLLIAFLIIHAIALFALSPSPVGDEAHFIPTIQHFASAPTLQTLRTYDEMSGPLPFITYAIWGKAFGFSTLSLRLCALLIAALTYIAIYQLFATWSIQRPVLLTLCALILLNPYMIALSTLVYTDMPAIGFGVLYCWAFAKRKPVVACIALAAALLCRQHAACFVIAGLIASIRDRRMFIATALATLPLIGLMFFWQGAAPDNAMRARYVAATRWNPASFILYLSTIAIYLAPLVAWQWRSIYTKRRVLLAIPCAALYLLFPVRVSEAAQAYGAQRVGFVDLAAQWLSPDFPLNDILFAAGFFAALPILFAILTQRTHRTRLLDAAVLSFLVMMPAAYIHWEKYLTLILPIVALRIYLLGERDPA